MDTKSVLPPEKEDTSFEQQIFLFDNNGRKNKMTLYELLNKISWILSPNTHEQLYEYLLHTSEDHGFLRTRYCYSPEPVPDHVVVETKTVLIALRQEYTEGNALYEEDGTTAVKMQIFYGEGDDEEAAQWSYELRYPFIYVVDLVNGTYTKENEFMNTVI